MATAWWPALSDFSRSFSRSGCGRETIDRFVRRLGWIALAVVVTQGILGGITVLFFLPAPVSVMHACLAQAFFCIVSSLALLTSESWKQ